MLRLLTCCALLLPIFLHAVPLDNDLREIGDPVVVPDADAAEDDGNDRKKRFYGYYGYSSFSSAAAPPAPPPVVDHGADGGRARVVDGCTEERKDTVFCTRPDADGIIEYGLSQETIDYIVAFHNTVRAEVKAKNMLEMHWDDEIAEYAQKWSQTCIKGHDKNAERRIPSWGVNMGQNWAGGSTVDGSLTNWAKEKTVYTFNNSAANEGKIVGHYTQMIQAHANAVGCGYSHCLNPSNGKYFHNFVCNYVYGQTANQVLEPYIQASTNRGKGSMCLEKTDTKLCKSNLVCKNGGKLNVSTGLCECKAPYTIGDECTEADCTVEDRNTCGSGVQIPENCNKYSNIRENCRRMCGDCPN